MNHIFNKFLSWFMNSYWLWHKMALHYSVMYCTFFPICIFCNKMTLVMPPKKVKCASDNGVQNPKLTLLQVWNTITEKKDL